MPYEVAGNAAGIDPEALMGSNEFIDNRTLGDSRRYQSAGGGACAGVFLRRGGIETAFASTCLSLITHLATDAPQKSWFLCVMHAGHCRRLIGTILIG